MAWSYGVLIEMIFALGLPSLVNGLEKVLDFDCVPQGPVRCPAMPAGFGAGPASKLRQVSLDLPFRNMSMKIPPFLLLERYESLVEVLAHDRARKIVCSKGRLSHLRACGEGSAPASAANSVSFRLYMFTINWIAGIEIMLDPVKPRASIMAAAR